MQMQAEGQAGAEETVQAGVQAEVGGRRRRRRRRTKQFSHAPCSSAKKKIEPEPA